jgi:hypothetical protein
MLLIHPLFGPLRWCEADSVQLQPDSTDVISAVPTETSERGCLQGWDQPNLNESASFGASSSDFTGSGRTFGLLTSHHVRDSPTVSIHISRRPSHPRGLHPHPLPRLHLSIPLLLHRAGPLDKDRGYMV